MEADFLFNVCIGLSNLVFANIQHCLFPYSEGATELPNMPQEAFLSQSSVSSLYVPLSSPILSLVAVRTFAGATAHNYRPYYPGNSGHVCSLRTVAHKEKQNRTVLTSFMAAQRQEGKEGVGRVSSDLQI